jgi:hypothetical protein
MKDGPHMQCIYDMSNVKFYASMCQHQYAHESI